MTDLLTTVEAKQAIGKGVLDQEKSALLDAFIGGVTAKIEERFGPVVYGTVTGELHCGGMGHVWLKNTPVASVVTVVEYDYTTAGTLTAESNTSKPAAGYTFNSVNGRLSRRNGNTADRFPTGNDNVYVTYVAGRCQGTLIPDKWKTAASVMLKNSWRAYELAAAQFGEFDVPQASFPTFAVPKFVDELLAGEVRRGSGTGD